MKKITLIFLFAYIVIFSSPSYSQNKDLILNCWVNSKVIYTDGEVKIFPRKEATLFFNEEKKTIIIEKIFEIGEERALLKYYFKIVSYEKGWFQAYKPKTKDSVTTSSLIFNLKDLTFNWAGTTPGGISTYFGVCY